MSVSKVNFQDQNSVRHYIQTVLFEAGQFLHTQGLAQAALNQEAFNQARQKKLISDDYRPTVINLFNIIDNGDSGFFSSKQISLFQNLHLFSSAPPPPGKARETDEERKKRESEAFWNKLIGTVVALVASFLTGFTYDEYAVQTKTLSKTTVIYTHSKLLQGPIQHNFQKLVSKQLKIDRLRTAKATHNFYTSILGLIGGAAWALGGYGKTPQLSTIGKVVDVIAGGWYLFNLARHWRDKDKIYRQCLKIAGDGQASMGWAQWILSHDLPNYHLDMTPMWVMPYPLAADQPPPSFLSEVDGEAAPLYPQLYSQQLRAPQGFAPIPGVYESRPSAPPL
ncbi:MAG: hypothetical protein JSS10_07175 [Verrucomicrobia bacterium]|nr:hypothetical protein [Verrucomicrobiota bacterium]